MICTGTAAAGSPVTIFSDGVAVGSGVANGGGHYMITTSTLSNGVRSIRATAADIAGNISVASSPLSVTIDTVVPPVTEGLASDTGAPSDKITSNPALSGAGDPNAVVTLREGATTLGTTTADGSGIWIFTPSLTDGTHTLTAIETDAAGNTGAASLTFTLDTTAPAIAITTPIAGDNVVNAAEASAGFGISGTAVGADGQIATIEIVDGSNTLKDSYAATVANGAWSINVTAAQAQALANGNYTVKADVADAAGNPAAEATQAITVAKAYTYITLDVPGNTGTYAHAINATDEVVGQYYDGSYQAHGFIYDGTSYTTLDVPGSTSTYAYAINATGEVAGQYYDGSYQPHGFLYDGTSYTTLDVPGSTSTYAYAINATGEVAGSTTTAAARTASYDGTSYTTLDAPGSTSTYAYAINATGEVAGSTTTAAARTASSTMAPATPPSMSRAALPPTPLTMPSTIRARSRGSTPTAAARTFPLRWHQLHHARCPGQHFHLCLCHQRHRRGRGTVLRRQLPAARLPLRWHQLHHARPLGQHFHYCPSHQRHGRGRGDLRRQRRRVSRFHLR